MRLFRYEKHTARPESVLGPLPHAEGWLYCLSVPVRVEIRVSLGMVMEHGPSRYQAELLGSERPDFRIARGHIDTQIVRHAASPPDKKNTWMGSRFVSPSQ